MKPANANRIQSRHPCQRNKSSGCLTYTADRHPSKYSTKERERTKTVVYISTLSVDCGRETRYEWWIFKLAGKSTNQVGRSKPMTAGPVGQLIKIKEKEKTVGTLDLPVSRSSRRWCWIDHHLFWPRLEKPEEEDGGRFWLPAGWFGRKSRHEPDSGLVLGHDLWHFNHVATTGRVPSLFLFFWNSFTSALPYYEWCVASDGSNVSIRVRFE